MGTFFVTENPVRHQKRRENGVETIGLAGAVMRVWIRADEVSCRNFVDQEHVDTDGDEALISALSVTKFAVSFVDRIDGQEERTTFIFETLAIRQVVLDAMDGVFGWIRRGDESSAAGSFRFMQNFSTWEMIAKKFGLRESLARFAVCQRVGIIHSADLVAVLGIDRADDFVATIDLFAEVANVSFRDFAPQFGVVTDDEVAADTIVPAPTVVVSGSDESACVV